MIKSSWVCTLDLGLESKSHSNLPRDWNYLNCSPDTDFWNSGIDLYPHFNFGISPLFYLAVPHTVLHAQVLNNSLLWVYMNALSKNSTLVLFNPKNYWATAGVINGKEVFPDFWVELALQTTRRYIICKQMFD